MESRSFIKAANQLAKTFRDYRMQEVVLGSNNSQQRAHLQREANNLFAVMHNPTLLAADNLYTAAMEAGLQVAPAVQQKIHRGRQMWN